MSRTDANFFLSSLSAHTDVCVVHPSASSYFKLASKPLGASSKREKHKDNLYLQRAKAIGSLFFPLVFESFGAIGTRSRDFIKLLSDEAAKNSITKLYGLPVLLRSISTVLQSSNAIICSNAGVSCRSGGRGS
jgi:hypothetical protein